MLDSVTRAQFEEWLAYREIDPDPMDRIIHILRLGFCAICNAWGAKLEPKDFDPFAEGEASATSESQQLSPQQAAAMFTTVFGAPN